MPCSAARRAALVLCAIGLFCVAQAARADQLPDRVLEQTHTFRLEQQGATFALEERVHQRYRLVTERATRQTEYAVYEPFYAPVERLEASVGRDRLGRRDIREVMIEAQDVFLSGGRVHVLELPRTPSVGEEVDIEYRRTYSDLAYAPLLRVPNVDRLERYEIVVEHPAFVRVDFGLFFPRGDLAAIREEEQGRTTLRFTGIDGVPSLPLFAFNDAHAVVQLIFSWEDGRGPLNPVAPDDFAAWYTRRVDRALAGRPSLAELATSLKADTPEETIAALHDYVRSTIRYIADERDENAFVPRAPDVVLERSYGDCKDRAFLVSALARELGYEVDVVLVSTEPEPEFEGTHVGLFNHVINVYDTEDGRQVFFDPTHRYMPYGALPEGDVEGQALRLSATKAELLRVPSPEAAPALDVTVQASLADMQAGVAEVTVRGPLLAYVRQEQERGLALDVENALIAVTSAYLYKMEFDDFEEIKDDGDAVTFRAQADLSEFAVASPTRRYLPQTPFVAVSAEVLERADDPYAIHHDDRPNLSLTLNLEAGPWNAAPADVALGVDGDPARFAAALRPGEEGHTRITYTFRQDRKRLTGSLRDTFVDFARDYLGARRDMFIFRQEPAADATTGG